MVTTALLRSLAVTRFPAWGQRSWGGPYDPAMLTLGFETADRDVVAQTDIATLADVVEILSGEETTDTKLIHAGEQWFF